MLIQPQSFTEFQQQALLGNVIPIAESILADMLTPVAAYLRLCRESEDSFLLESVEGGEKVARYSFLGHNAREWVETDGQSVFERNAQGTRQIEGDIFSALKNKLGQFKFISRPDLPRFCGGMVGFFGYDTVRLIEKLPATNPVEENRIIASLAFMTQSSPLITCGSK